MVQKIMVPPYFGPISCWKQIINSTILWDVHQNYIKQLTEIEHLFTQQMGFKN
jgi:hypothetical protein